MQTTLILTEAAPATRSRVMGIVTICIGTGPVGVMMVGILSGQVGPPVAILIPSGPVCSRLTAGGEWIRTFSSAMPRRRRELGCFHSAVRFAEQQTHLAALLKPC